jgi:hypothetical protein
LSCTRTFDRNFSKLISVCSVSLLSPLTGKELQQLQEKLDHMKLAHYESSQEIHREQIEIIENLQANYLEYRLMVENLFYTEARALEEKLTAQQHKYETEIKYILRMKDHQFHTMITSKDAKIMNLIEGTDFSRILMKHQMELEGMKKTHEREIDVVREQAGQENKKMVIDLKRDIIARQTEIDKYHTQILTWEKKLEQTLGQWRRTETTMNATIHAVASCLLLTFFFFV